MRKILMFTVGLWLAQAPFALAQEAASPSDQIQYQQMTENDTHPPATQLIPGKVAYPPVYYSQQNAAHTPQQGDYGYSVINDLRQLNF